MTTDTPSDAAIGQAFREQYQVPRGEHGAVRAYVNQVFERAREIEQGRGALQAAKTMLEKKDE